VAIASSDLVRQLVKERGTARTGEGAAARLAAYRNAAAIVDVMQSIIGPYKPVPQVNLYTLSGEMIGAGVFSQAARVPYREVPWLAGGVDTSSGGTRFSRPHMDALLGKTQALYEGRSYLSIYRTVFDESRSAIGVLEVKQFVDTIFRSFSTLSGKAIVFDPTWFQIYPLEGQAQPSVPAALRTARDGEILTLRDPRTAAREIGIVAFSQQADWRVAVLQEQRLLLAPVRSFASVILLTGAVLAAAAVLVASRLAARITVPLARIHNALRGLDWDALARDGGPAGSATGVGELETRWRGTGDRQGRRPASGNWKSWRQRSTACAPRCAARWTKPWRRAHTRRRPHCSPCSPRWIPTSSTTCSRRSASWRRKA